MFSYVSPDKFHGIVPDFIAAATFGIVYDADTFGHDPLGKAIKLCWQQAISVGIMPVFFGPDLVPDLLDFRIHSSIILYPDLPVNQTK